MEKQLGGILGVKRAGLNLASARATVEYDAARVGIRDLIAAIERTSYPYRYLLRPAVAVMYQRVALRSGWRAYSACSRASRAKSVRIELLTHQPTIRRAKRR